MTDSFDNDVQVAESCVGKIKFSVICKALKEGGIDFDVPGCLLAAEAEGVYSRFVLDKEDDFNSQMFRMASNACSRLVTNAMMVEPDAWSVLAEWHARNLQTKAKREALSDLLAEL